MCASCRLSSYGEHSYAFVSHARKRAWCLGRQPADLHEEMVSYCALAHAAGVACHTHSTRASWRWMTSCSALCWQTKGVLASS